MQQIPLVGAIRLGEAFQEALDGATLHLFVTGYQPTPGETLANLEAVEATFSGYPDGGYTLGEWSAPQFNPYGGAQVVCQQVNPVFTSPSSGSPVQNQIQGYFIVDSEGNLIADGTFAQVIFMGANGDGFPITVALFVGTEQVLVQCWVYGSEQD